MTREQWKHWEKRFKQWAIITFILLILMFPVGMLAFVIGALYLLADSPE